VRRKDPRVKPTPHYSLKSIYKLINEGSYLIRINAKISASEDFGWNTEDIIDAIKKLKACNFVRTNCHHRYPETMIDHYIASELNGEDIYTHFYVNRENILIINSFKKNEDIK